MNEPLTPEARDKLLRSVELLEVALAEAGVKIDAAVQPVRQTVLKLYPLLFAILVSTGVAATILGLERILLEVSLFDEHPWLLFACGIGILAITGRIYKKLG